MSIVLPVTTVTDKLLEELFKQIAENGSEILMALELMKHIASKYKDNPELTVSVHCFCRRVETYIESMSSKQNSEEVMHNIIASAMTRHLEKHNAYLVNATQQTEIHLPGHDELIRKRATFVGGVQTYEVPPKNTSVTKMNVTPVCGLVLALDLTTDASFYKSMLPFGYVFDVINNSSTPHIHKRYELASVCWAYYTLLVCFYDIAVDRNKVIGKPEANKEFISFLKTPLTESQTYGAWLRSQLAVYRDFTVDYRMTNVHKNTGMKKALGGLKNGESLKDMISKLKDMTESGDISSIMSLLPNFLPQ